MFQKNMNYLNTCLIGLIKSTRNWVNLVLV